MPKEEAGYRKHSFNKASVLLVALGPFLFLQDLLSDKNRVMVLSLGV